ncbi:syntaxin-7-like isoform X2 [Amblyomma americanum]
MDIKDGDTSQRYHQLCDNISSSIFSINNATATLERASKQLGTQADTDAFREKLHMTQQNANLTIKSTTSALQDLGALVTHGDKQQKLQSSRLRSEFQEVVKRYSNLQKQVATRQKYTMGVRPGSAATRPSGGGVAPQTGGWFDAPRPEEATSLLDDVESPQSPTQQQQQHWRQDLDYEQAMLVERDQRIRQIEADMLDCNQIFKDLANIVHEQGAVIDTIEGNIENTQQNTAQAVEQLRSAASYQRKYRQKTCCLLVLVVVVAAVVALVIYFSIHK